MLQGSTLKIDPNFHIDDSEIAVFTLSNASDGALMTVTLDFSAVPHKISTNVLPAGANLTLFEQATVVKEAVDILDCCFGEGDPSSTKVF